MKVLYWGTPQFAVPTLQRLLTDAQFEVLGVVTQPDKRRGRGSQLTPSPVKALALAHQLPVWQSARIKQDESILAELRSLEADVFVVVAYGQILSPEILAMPRLGCINNHGSLLPKYRGAAPIQWALYHGEAETGITTMLMDAGMDTGEMLLQSAIPVTLLDNAQDMAIRLAELGAELMVETLKQLAAEEITPVSQNSEQATYAPLIHRPDYLLNWNQSAIALHNQVRGFYPNCLAQFQQQPLKILATAPLSPATESQLPVALQALAAEWQPRLDQSEPGTVVGVVKSIGPIVQTQAGGLLLREVQLAGKRAQSGWEFANGVRLAVGNLLTNGQ